jgi:hypothetical protein
MRIGDLDARNNLVATCSACGHEAVLDRSRLPPAAEIDAIGPRCRCTSCGAAGARVEIRPPHGFIPDYRYPKW